MLTIARTLMGNPELILIDEPTEGLAPKLVEKVNEVIGEIKARKITILLVEQKLHSCLRLADRVYVISKGSIQWEGTPEELNSRGDIRKEYLEV